MASSPDLTAQQLGTVATSQSPLPTTIAATTTLAPINTGLTFVSGSTPNIATITPPIQAAHMIGLVFTNAAPPQLLTTGNISVGTTTLVQNKLTLLWYDPSSNKYYFNS